MVDGIKRGSCEQWKGEEQKEGEVERKKRKNRKKERTHRENREIQVVGIETCINRPHFPLPLKRPILSRIENWNLNHLGHFSKVRNFYGRSLL